MDPFNPPVVTRRMNYSVADFYDQCQRNAERDRMKRLHELFEEMQLITTCDRKTGSPDFVVEISNAFTRKLNHI